MIPQIIIWWLISYPIVALRIQYNILLKSVLFALFQQLYSDCLSLSTLTLLWQFIVTGHSVASSVHSGIIMLITWVSHIVMR